MGHPPLYITFSIHLSVHPFICLSVCCASHLRNLHHLIIVFETHDISRHFFDFFKILIFQVVREVKGQKMVQNDKKFCPLYFISQEHTLYDCHLWCTCVNDNISILGKNGPKWQKILSVSLYLTNPTSYYWVLWFLIHMCKMMISPAVFFIIKNFDFWSFRGVKGQKMT